MIELKEIKFNKEGLIPCIVRDYITKDVLTLAYMNEESLKISLLNGLTCFFSRSRKKLWLKGETSSNYQYIVDMYLDCDKDAILVDVLRDGVACHTGKDSCFHNLVYRAELVDVYNKDKKLTGKVRPRKYSFRENEYMLYVIALIENKAGEFLFIKRSENKEYAGGYFEIPGGAVMSGEDSREAIIREIKEETGLKVKDINLVYSYRNDENGRYFMDIYHTKSCFERDDIRLNDESTEFILARKERLEELRTEGGVLHYERIRATLTKIGD